MGEVLAAHHVRRVAARGAKQPNVEPQGGEAVAGADGVHRLEERSLGAGESASPRGRRGAQEGEKCHKSYENLGFNWHSRECGDADLGSHPPKGVDRLSVRGGL